MATTKFAQVLQRDLAEDLTLRGYTVTQSFGTSGDPMLLVGTGATTTQTALIRILPEDTLQVNSVGVTQTVYTPHKIQLAIEENTSGGVTFLTLANALKLAAAILPKGTKVEVFLVATGDMPLNEADFADSDTQLVAVLYPNLYHPLTAQS